jgi:GTP-binding protein YchF
LKVGIVGLPGVGKTTLFRALTHGSATQESHSGISNGVVPVPDERFDWQVEFFKPKKATPAVVEFVDGAPSMGEDTRKFIAGFLAQVRSVDALLHLVRCYESDILGAPSPASDLQRILDELVLADLQMVETRLERLEKSLHSTKAGTVTVHTIERDLMRQIRDWLEAEKPLAAFPFTGDQSKQVSGFEFLTLKPAMVVANTSEAEVGQEPAGPVAELKSYCETNGLEFVAVCAKVEAEIAELPEQEQAEYLEAMGLERPARNQIIQEAYRATGMISFFTSGEPEVRAWTIAAGSHVIEAAEKIHSDIARGFIRAEVANYDVVKEAGGWDEAKRQSKVGLYMKDYVMQDGDVVYIRFKV